LNALIHAAGRQIAGVILLLGLAIFLYDIRHGAPMYCKLLKAAWPKEKRGEGLVGGVNKGGMTLGSLLLLVFYVGSEVKGWLRPEAKALPWLFWLICFCSLIGLLAISLWVLAGVERAKLLVPPRGRSLRL
jgi:hypothetical protein